MVFDYFGRTKTIGTATVLSVLFCLIVRYSVSAGSYSGKGTPPMFGDYEAQRHWMEVTTNLPVQEWYQNTTSNNLSYWGLDYPPLTAYHSYAIGLVASHVEPTSMILHTSHGYESSTSKLLMRLSSFLSDGLVLISGFVAFYRQVQVPPAYRMYGLWVALLSPALILIDHGHFQFNAVSLGLALWAVVFIAKDRVYVGSCCFCLALCFKQISLYYAFGFFFYLLGKTFSGSAPLSEKVARLAILGVTVLLTMCIIFSPWIYFSVSQQSFEPIAQVFRRVFPFNRGLFEDKVANFWCCSGLIFKWKQRMSLPTTLKLCTLCTVLASIPSGFRVLRHPTKQGFLYCLATSSLGFFLFSYHVHEKSILFPLLPVLCLAAEHPILVRWATVVCCFSMFPLLRQDGLTWQYVAAQLVFLVGSHGLLRCLPTSPRSPTLFSSTPPLVQLSFVSLLGTHAIDQILWRLMSPECPVWLSVPQKHLLPLLHRYPDLGLYAFAICSFLHFTVLYALLLRAHFRTEAKFKPF